MKVKANSITFWILSGICLSLILPSIVPEARAASQQKKYVLKPIDPSQAKFDEPEPAPPVLGATPAPEEPRDPSPTALPKRTLDNPNPPQSFPSDGQVPQFGQPWPTSQPNANMPPYSGPGWGAGQSAPSQAQSVNPVELRINRLEQTAFGATYPEHEVEDRVDHLERELFGKKIEGSVPDRMARLESKLGLVMPARPAYPTAMAQPRPQQMPMQQMPMQQMPMQQMPMQQMPMQQMPMQQMPMQQMPMQQMPMQQRQLPPQMNATPQPYAPYQQMPANRAPAQPYYNPAFPPQAYPYQPAPQQPMTYAQAPLSPPPLGYNPAAQISTVPPVPVQAPKSNLDNHSQESALSKFQGAIAAIPEKKAAGDYLSGISKFAGTAVARWNRFPITLHLPQGGPENWTKLMKVAVERWNDYIPVKVASPDEAADIEVAFINHLPVRQIGLTNLEIFNGRLRITIYLLRPTYYPPGTSEKILQNAAMHHIGHAIGLFGHSSDAQDLMFPLDVQNSIKPRSLSARDLNTLKKVYETGAIPADFQIPNPMGWP